MSNIYHFTLLDGYIAFIVIMATVFSIKNNNNNPIGERFVFWGLFPLGIVLIFMWKLIAWRKVKLRDRLISSCGELYNF